MYPVIRHRAKPRAWLPAEISQSGNIQNPRKVKKRGYKVSEITGVVSKERGDIEDKG